jgi:hypothetical protein
MIATSYLATLLSFRRPQDRGLPTRRQATQIIYGAAFSGTSISGSAIFSDRPLTSPYRRNGEDPANRRF